MLAVAGEQPDAVALAPRQDAKAVVLDFMNPNVGGEFARRGRQGWKGMAP